MAARGFDNSCALAFGGNRLRSDSIYCRILFRRKKQVHLLVLIRSKSAKMIPVSFRLQLRDWPDAGPQGRAGRRRGEERPSGAPSVLPGSLIPAGRLVEGYGAATATNVDDNDSARVRGQPPGWRPGTCHIYKGCEAFKDK